MSDFLDNVQTTRAVQAAESKNDERLQAIIDAIGSKVNPQDVRILGSSIDKLNSALDKMGNLELDVKTDQELKSSLSGVSQAIKSIDVRPVVNVPQPKVTVEQNEVNLTPVISQLDKLTSAVKSNKSAPTDNSALEAAVKATTDAINGLVFPTANYVLPFAGSNGEATQVQLDSSGNVPVAGTISVDTTGLATDTKQDTGNTSLANIDTKMDALTTPSDTQPVSGTVTANLSATDNSVLDSIDTSTASKYITSIGHGVKTVTAAGTDVALASSTACKKVTIQSQTDNTGLIAVGGSGVDATESTGTGIILYPGDSYEFDIDNLSDVFIDATVSGEGVRFTYFN